MQFQQIHYKIIHHTSVQSGCTSSVAYNFAYNRQAAFYLDGFNAKEFVFIVIESNAPHQIGIFRCSEDFIESGRQEYIELLEDKKRYCETAEEANNHIIHEEL